MYLAIKEILQNKLRYGLILTTIFLIAFMVFFMTSLALGLVRNNRAAIDNWQATGVVLSDYANDNLTASFILEKDYQNKVSEGSAPLGYMFAVTNLVNVSEKINVSIFGQKWDSFISPDLIEGDYPKEDDEVVVDKSFENYGIKMCDVIQLNGNDTSYKIVGLTQGNKFFTEPVVFTSLTTFCTLQETIKSTRSISALVLKNDIDVSGDNLKQITIQRMNSKIPGYTPQVNVFSGMILAMIVITGLIVGIFIYIIIIQKLGLYGIMRAQGIQIGTIVWSLFCQIFLLSSMGIGLAVLSIWGVILVLPATFFFYPSWLAYSALSLVICLVAMLDLIDRLDKDKKLEK